MKEKTLLNILEWTPYIGPVAFMFAAIGENSSVINKKDKERLEKHTNPWKKYNLKQKTWLAWQGATFFPASYGLAELYEIVKPYLLH